MRVRMLQVLQSIPEGMIPYYKRTLRAMADNKEEKFIAKAILVWVVASSRKMNMIGTWKCAEDRHQYRSA